jgi:hypothetical protein
MMIFDDVVENDICMLCAARLIFFYLLTCSLTLDLPLLYKDLSNINSIILYIKNAYYFVYKC